MINEQKIPVVIRDFYWFFLFFCCYFLKCASWCIRVMVITGICVILYYYCFWSNMSVNGRHGGCMICVCKSFVTAAGVVSAACCCVPTLPQTLPPSCCDWTDFWVWAGCSCCPHYPLFVWANSLVHHWWHRPWLATSRQLCWADVVLPFP